MELTKKTVLTLISFLLLFEGIGKIFYGLIECSKYLAIENGISWTLLIVVVSVITLTIYAITVKKVLSNNKNILISGSIFIVAFLLLTMVNQWVGNWLGTLEQEKLNQMILAEQIVGYSKHIYLLLSLIALGVIFRQVKIKN